MELPPIVTPTEQDKAKLAAGRYAAEDRIKDGMKVGLGSGTTSHYFVRALAERVREGLDIICATTSTSTRDLGSALGINIVDLDELGRLDVTVDGPDEIDRDGVMIKGGGACLLWEKLLERVSDTVVIVADSSKLVDRLGAFPLPIEIVKYSPETTTGEVRRVLERHGYDGDIRIERRQTDGKDVITDNGNYVIDAHLGELRDDRELTVELNQIPGVVENGIFVDITDEVVFGWSDGRAEAYSLPITLGK